MDSLIRINSIINKALSGNPEINGRSIISALKNAPPADITVLPALALMPPSSHMLFTHRGYIEKCFASLKEIMAATAEKDGYLICGLPVMDLGKAVPATAVMAHGKLLGLLPDLGDYSGLSKNFSTQFLPMGTVFQSGDLRFCIASCASRDMLLTAAELSKSGCSLMIFPTYYAVTAGSTQNTFETLKVISKQYNVAAVNVNGGIGDTSSPHVYDGLISVFENGENMGLRHGGDESTNFCCDIDTDIVCQDNNTNGSAESFYFLNPIEKQEILREINRCPFLPHDDFQKNVYLDELFDLQVKGVALRLLNTGIKNIVLGVSGGLDSTLALMVGVAALDRLSIPRENLYCITMPGFGTSDRTYYNALGLMEALHVTKEDISIRASVLQHFEDISHNIMDRNVTYENAQARERTQILFDISNDIGGFVIGTGDLSENALGWCTFGGDSIAGFNVNICIPKTVVRLLVNRLAKTSRIKGTESFLLDILQTPVSPELLPSDEAGEIAQKTEEILGSYDLHDFFLYYFVKYGFSPLKLFNYAVAAFENEFTPTEIKSRLLIFIKRFFSSQFKRSCAPDSADITEVNLSNGKWQMPSDLNIGSIIKEVEDIKL